MASDMTDIEVIAKVAAFAAPAGTTHGTHWEGIHFHEGSVFAQDQHGGMLSLLQDVKLNCSVSGSLMQKVLKAVGSSSHVKFKTTKKELIVTAGQSEAKLPLMSPNMEPKFYRPDAKVKWAVTDALVNVDRVAWAVSNDAFRAHLSGLHLGENGIEATNGHVGVQLRCENFKKLLGTEVLVPAAPLKHIGEGNRYIACDDRRFYVSEDEEGTRYLSLKLIDGQFPDLDAVLPQGQPSAQVTKEQLVDAVKRAKVSGNKAILQVSGDRLSFESHTADQNTLFNFIDSVELRDIEKGFNVKPIGLNLDYMEKAVKHTGDGEIELRTKDSLAPFEVASAKYTAVIMPVRVD